MSYGLRVMGYGLWVMGIMFQGHFIFPFLLLSFN